MDETATSVGVVGRVSSGIGIRAAESSGPDPSGRRRITMRTACPDANAPMTPCTPTARRRPPDSRRDRTLCAPESMITLPAGKSVWLVHDFKSRIGRTDAVNTVCGGRISVGVAGPDGSVVGLVRPERGSEGVPGLDLCELWYSMIENMLSGFLLEEIIVVTPAPVAISAAISFVSIPPVPRLDPRVVVLTVASG